MAMTQAQTRVAEAVAEDKKHLKHMTNGRWHDDCLACLRRRVKGGTGLYEPREDEMR